MYVLHSLQGHFSVSQLEIFALKESKDSQLLNSSGNIFHILGPSQDKVSVPYLTVLTLVLSNEEVSRRLYKGSVNLNISFIITGLSPFLVLKISVART